MKCGKFGNQSQEPTDDKFVCFTFQSRLSRSFFFDQIKFSPMIAQALAVQKVNNGNWTECSPHVRESGLESDKILLLESWIWEILLLESGILGSGIRNTAQGIRNPTNDWNPESKFHWHGLESSTWNPQSMAWNPESKAVLDSLTWRKSGVQFGPWNDKYYFRPKLHDMKFNYHFTPAIFEIAEFSH